MKYLTIIFLFFVSSVVQGQSYFEAKLVLNDGTLKTGYAKVPDGGQKKVDFKVSLDGKSAKLNSDEIFSITFTLEDGRSHILERNQIKMIGTKKSGEILSRVGKKKVWLYVGHSDPVMNYYSAGQKYKIDKDGDFRISSSGQTGFTGIGYYLRRPEEEPVTYITARMSGIQIAHEKMFRNAVSTYLSDNKELVDRINNKEFKSKEVYEVYEIYISDKNTK